jgi:hypothetical protein
MKKKNQEGTIDLVLVIDIEIEIIQVIEVTIGNIQVMEITIESIQVMEITIESQFRKDNCTYIHFKPLVKVLSDC